jgi:hypothetical protein
MRPGNVHRHTGPTRSRCVIPAGATPEPESAEIVCKGSDRATRCAGARARGSTSVAQPRRNRRPPPPGAGGNRSRANADGQPGTGALSKLCNCGSGSTACTWCCHTVCIRPRAWPHLLGRVRKAPGPERHVVVPSAATQFGHRNKTSAAAAGGERRRGARAAGGSARVWAGARAVGGTAWRAAALGRVPPGQATRRRGWRRP